MRSLLLQPGEGDTGQGCEAPLRQNLVLGEGRQTYHWFWVFRFLLREIWKVNFPFSEKQVAISRFCSELVLSPASSPLLSLWSQAKVSPSLSRPAAALPALALYPLFYCPSAAAFQLIDCHRSIPYLLHLLFFLQNRKQWPDPNGGISAASGCLQLFSFFQKVRCIRQEMLQHAKSPLTNFALTFPILPSSPVVCSWVPSTRSQDSWFPPSGHCQLPYMSFSYRDWMKTYTVLEC